MSMQAEKPAIRYENAAEQVTVTGWACLTCRRWYGDDEHLARYCCATDFPCNCGARKGKTHTCCDDCRSAKDAERWAARERREWKGEPLYSEVTNDFYFDSDDLQDAVDDGADLESLRLVFCTPRYPSLLDSDYWHDDFTEDDDLDSFPALAAAVDQVNKAIDAMRAAEKPVSWWPGKVAAIVPYTTVHLPPEDEETVEQAP